MRGEINCILIIADQTLCLMETFVILAFVVFTILVIFLWWREKQWEKTPEGRDHLEKLAKEEAARVQSLKDKYGEEFYLASERGEMMIGMHKDLLNTFLDPDEIGNVTISKDSKSEEWFFYKRDDTGKALPDADKNEAYRLILTLENDLLKNIHDPTKRRH